MLIMPFLAIPCYAEGRQTAASANMDIYAVTEELPDDVKSIGGNLTLDGKYDSGGAMKRLLDSFVKSVTRELRSDIKTVFGIAAISIFCSAGMSVCTDKRLEEYIGIAACVAAAYSLVGSMNGIVSSASTALNQLSDYSKAAMPAVFAASAACGAVVSSPVKYAAVCLAVDVLMSAAQKLVIPLVYCYLAIAITGSISPNSILRAAARTVKWLATTVMTGITIAFSAYIGITGLIAGSTDATAVKTAKTVISTSLPVVGGIISDAASVVLSAASMIKNSAGAFCLVVVCAMCIAPFASISVKMFLFRISAAIAEMMPGGRLSALLNDIGTAMSLLLGLVGCCGIMLFISFMAAIKVVAV